jgi:hypothetical protein
MMLAEAARIPPDALTVMRGISTSAIVQAAQTVEDTGCLGIPTE